MVLQNVIDNNATQRREEWGVCIWTPRDPSACPKSVSLISAPGASSQPHLFRYRPRITNRLSAPINIYIQPAPLQEAMYLLHSRPNSIVFCSSPLMSETVLQMGHLSSRDSGEAGTINHNSSCIDSELMISSHRAGGGLKRFQDESPSPPYLYRCTVHTVRILAWLDDRA